MSSRSLASIASRVFGASLLSFFVVASVPGCGGGASNADGSGSGSGGTATTKDASVGKGKDASAGKTGGSSKDGGGSTSGGDDDDGTGDDGSTGDDAATVNPGCVKQSDCVTGICTNGACVATFTDGMLDGAETDTDCGGALNSDGSTNPNSDGAPVCGDNKACLVGRDCVNLVCFAGNASASPSADGSPIDCPSGSTCTCQPATVTDGVKNDSETDRDCGGQRGAGGVANATSDQAGIAASLCRGGTGASGQLCKFVTDCDGGACNANAGSGGLPLDCPAGSTCNCQLASSTDTLLNGGESDIDCGSQSDDGARPCADVNPYTHAASSCVVAGDCASGHCGSTGKCVPPSFTDGIKNGNETDVDCGGALNAAGAAAAGSDGAPKCPDMIGTPSGPSKCLLGTDCKSGFCSSVHFTCVDGQSCAVPTMGIAVPIQDVIKEATAKSDAVGSQNAEGLGEVAGIDSCGRGESTDESGLRTHESCCKSLDLAIPAEATTVRIDKYEVTAGRMRQFVEAVSALEGGTYNVRAWVKAQFSTDGAFTPLTAAGRALAKQIPTVPQSGAADVIDLFPQSADGNDPLNIVQQLGGTTMDEGVPSNFQGCYMNTGSVGASTYWFNKDGSTQVGSPPRAFTQDYYDIKSMNCTPYWMAAAFCAWDGGHLPTHAEYDTLWGTGTYPWGNDSRLYGNLGTRPPTTLITDFTINNINEEYNFYFYPAANQNPSSGTLGAASIVDTIDNGYDFTPFIAAPGRFTRDVTAIRASGQYAGDAWYDVGANLFEYEGQTSFVGGIDFCDTTGNVAPTNGSCPGANPCQRTDSGGQVMCGVDRTTTGMVGIIWEGGSWEVHTIPGGPDNNYVEPMETQYGKAGFRCARDLE